MLFRENRFINNLTEEIRLKAVKYLKNVADCYTLTILNFNPASIYFEVL